MDAETLSIILPADVAERVRRRVASGSYGSDSDVIREALRLFEDREAERVRHLDVVRAKIKAAVDDPRSISDDELGRRLQTRFEEAERRVRR